MISRKSSLRKGKSIVKVNAVLVTIVACLFVSSLVFVNAAPPLTGAIFTTSSSCNGVDLNIYKCKEDVYVNGGPAHPNAAGLPDGFYFVRVTEPNGTLLGTSVPNTPVHVTAGAFDQCYQLSAIVTKASDNTPGYDTTTNPGGEYKVWVSSDSTFVESASKTDNFKSGVCDPNCDPDVDPNCGGGDVDTAEIIAVKFYDANANGINDDGQEISGWGVCVQQDAGILDCSHVTRLDMTVVPDGYTVSEKNPIQGNWVHTTPTSEHFSVIAGEVHTTEFGNVCLGAGGGLTLGYWSNKNGGKVITGPPSLLAGVLALNLRNANGTLLGSVNLANFQKFLLNANASNMANMLSAQLAAMYLNRASGGVSGSALVYAPCLIGSAANENALGFISINDLIAAANASLGTDGYTVAAGPIRSYQECLKNALDKGNNNLNFVQATPCPFSFQQQ